MRTLTFVIATALLLGGCREGDGPAEPGTGGARLVVSSEPSGAQIFVNNRDTGLRTPDTLRISGQNDIHVRLDSAGFRYEYNVRMTLFASDTVAHLHGPLALQCGFSNDLSGCYRTLQRYRTSAGVRFATNPLGSVFLYDGQGQGALWPATSTNSYVSGGIPVFAARVGNSRVAVGMYDHAYLAGRPVPVTTTSGGRTTLRQHTWIVPPTPVHLTLPTVRGIEVREEIVTDDAVSDVVMIRLTFRNVTGTLEYALIDPFMPIGGVTFTDAYIGLALDPDIGTSTDDWLSYDPALDIAFAYDARFNESAFGADAARPALVGVRALRAPAGSTVLLNGWVNRNSGLSDWTAGSNTETLGYGMLSGTNPYPPAHPHPRIGHLPGAEGDMRLSLTAGPLTLAPGEEAEIVIAVAFARPAPGTFTSGTQLPPGDPEDTNRALYRVAAPLRERLVAAQSLLGG